MISIVNVKKLLLVSLVCLFFSGCGVVVSNKNSSAMTKLNIGDSASTTLAIMGEPSSKEAYKGKEYWLYRINNSGSGEKGRYIPVVLENGKVIGWGSKYWDEIRSPEPTNTSSSAGSGGGGVLLIPQINTVAPSMAPFMTNPSSAIVRGNTQPFQQSEPQLPIQKPSVNCTPNGMGGFRCQ